MPGSHIDPRWTRAGGHSLTLAGIERARQALDDSTVLAHYAMAAQTGATVPESIERIDCYADYTNTLWADNNRNLAQEQRRSVGNYFVGNYFTKLAALVKLKARNGLTNNPGFKSYFRKRVRDYLVSELKDLLACTNIPTSDMRLQLCGQAPTMATVGFAPSFVEQLDSYINHAEYSQAIQSAKLIGLVNNRHILIGFFGLAYLQLVLLQVENTGSSPFSFVSRPYRTLANNNNVSITWEPDSTSWPLLLPLQELDVVRFFSSADYRRTATNLDCGGLNTLNPSYPALTRPDVFRTGITRDTLRHHPQSSESSWYNEAIRMPGVADQLVQAVPSNTAPQQVYYTTEAPENEARQRALNAQQMMERALLATHITPDDDTEALS